MMSPLKCVQTLSILNMLVITLLFFCLDKGNGKEIRTLTTNITTNVTHTMKTFCPYNKFCRSAPLKESDRPDQVSCCEACSCESDCFETGSCCPDMTLPEIAKQKYPCKHLRSFGKNIFDVDRDSTYYWYHIIDGCPEGTNVKFYERCYKPKELLDYVIVTDARTGKVYKNEHCAQCNNVFSYDKVKLRISCEGSSFISLENFTSVQATKDYIMEECSISSNPPETRIALSHCLPESMVISTCNATNEWDFYDFEIEKGCLTNQTNQNLLFKGSYNQFRAYRYFANVYCYLCNVGKRTNYNYTCDKPEKEEESKSGFISMYAIIDWRTLEDNKETVAGSLCDSSMIWDPFQGLCRTVFCPSGFIPHNGRCKLLLSNIYGRTFALHFQVIIKDGKFVTDSLLLHYLEYRLTQELGADIDCGQCRAGLFSSNNLTSQIFMRYEIFTTERCKFDTLTERLRNIVIRKEINLRFRYRNRIIHITLALIYDDIQRTTGYNLLSERTHSFCISVQNVDESILLQCASLKLSRQEVYHLGLKNIPYPSNDVTLQRDGNPEELEQICVKDYFEYLTAANSVSAVRCYLTNFTISFTVILLTSVMKNL